MTSNQIAYKQAKEQKRSNLAKEKLEAGKQNLERRGQNLKTTTDLLKVAGNALNDEAWYLLDKALADDVANISFNNPLGNRYQTELNNEYSVANGICVLNFSGTIGQTDIGMESSVATVAARNIYSFVRYANSGARNYEAPDLFMYIMGVGELIALHGALSRIYSVALTAKGENRYYPKAMLYALGCNADDIIGNLAQLRTAINILGMKINALYIPKEISMITRKYWMNTTIHKDQPVKKSQLYVYVQRNFRYYDDVTGSLRTDIRIGSTDTYYNGKTQFYPGANFTVKDIVNLVNILTDKAFSSEDMGIMSGDILKAYGENGVFSIMTIGEDFHIEETYSLEVLSQITNADITNADTPDITQDVETGSIIQGTKIYDFASRNELGYGIIADYGYDLSVTRQHVMANRRLINFYKDNPTTGDVMVATRLATGNINNVSIFETAGNELDKRQTAIISYGTEMILHAYIIRYAVSNSAPETYRTLHKFNVVDSSTTALISCSVIASFDWFPRVMVGTTDEEAFAGAKFMSDLANYAIVSGESLNNMHYVAVLSEYGVPLLGNKVRGRSNS